MWSMPSGKAIVTRDARRCGDGGLPGTSSPRVSCAFAPQIRLEQTKFRKIEKISQQNFCANAAFPLDLVVRMSQDVVVSWLRDSLEVSHV
jgi:hypothetical protein